MDFLFGSTVSILILCLLLYAAIEDGQTREVTNWVWGIGLLSLPLTTFRMISAGFLLPYILQIGLIFLIGILGFQTGFWGGADGKALILIAFAYPWILLDYTWLLLAPFLVLLGGFLIVGIHSLIILFRNLVTSKRKQKTQIDKIQPSKRMYWFTRQFSGKNSEAAWNPVVVPLVLYFFVTYVVFLILSGVLMFLPT